MTTTAPLSNAPIGFGAGGPLPAPSPWVSFGSYIAYPNGGVVVGNPAGGSFGLGTINANNLYLNGVQFSTQNFLQINGGTITGDLTVSGNLTVTGTSSVNLDMGTY
jgi:hypothetical protein